MCNKNNNNKKSSQQIHIIRDNPCPRAPALAMPDGTLMISVTKVN